MSAAEVEAFIAETEKTPDKVKKRFREILQIN